MSRFRKDYDQQSFAFDLARLYISETDKMKNGRRFQFGPSRESNKSIRILLKQTFLDNPMLDNNFALACCMLTGSILGYPVLEDQSRDMLLAWLEGDRTVNLSQLRAYAFDRELMDHKNADLKSYQALWMRNRTRSWESGSTVLLIW